MGVLTKPDLATEEASKDTIRDLVLGKSSNLKLGYHVVKNRGADDHNSTLPDCLAAEESFFMDSTWSPIIDHCGIASLKPKLRGLLMNVSKQAMPHVKNDIEHNLQACKAKLEAMGPNRGDDQAQRLYLTKLASAFQDVTMAALNGYYAGHKVFTTHPNLKLITKMMKLNEDFSNTFQNRGHKLSFGSGWINDDNDDNGKFNEDCLSFEILSEAYPELTDILQGEAHPCPMPSDSPIMGLIEEVFASSRGPELGTVCGSCNKEAKLYLQSSSLAGLFWPRPLPSRPRSGRPLSFHTPAEPLCWSTTISSTSWPYCARRSKSESSSGMSTWWTSCAMHTAVP